MHPAKADSKMSTCRVLGLLGSIIIEGTGQNRHLPGMLCIASLTGNFQGESH